MFSLERVLGGLERVLGGTFLCLSINKRFRDRPPQQILFTIMLLRHAQTRNPKNEALLYSFIANEEVRYSR